MIANLFQLNNQTDKIILKFDNGVMIQGFRVTIASDRGWSNVMFPEPFANNNVFISHSYYGVGKHIIFDIGVSANDCLTLYHNETIEIQNSRPYGVYIIAVGMWK